MKYDNKNQWKTATIILVLLCFTLFIFYTFTIYSNQKGKEIVEANGVRFQKVLLDKAQQEFPESFHICNMKDDDCVTFKRMEETTNG